MQNSMMMFTFSISGWKYPFWANFVQKNQNYQFRHLSQFEYVEFNGRISRMGSSCVCVCVGEKAENCINYKIKISGAKQLGHKPIVQAVGRSTHSPQNKGKTLTVDVHFFCFRLDIPSLGKFGPKTQNC